MILNSVLIDGKSSFFLLLSSIIIIWNIIKIIGGNFRNKPDHLEKKLSAGAKELIKNAYGELVPDKIFDYHVHIIGTGVNNTGSFVNQGMRSWSNPVKRIKFSVYASASGITDMDNIDRQYVERLIELIENIKSRGRYLIIAFDKYYNKNGTANLDLTDFYVPNEYVYDLSKRCPEYFSAGISVHPYRQDALKELEKWAKVGIKIVKWLPAAMGIDPSDKSIIPFYKKMKRLKMILLTHAGHGEAVDSKKDQESGNPLLLRLPLETGIKVIVAHCGCLGRSTDFENPGNKSIDNFDLFLRLMDEKKYEELLFGEISSITQVNRLSRPLNDLILRKDLHPRLVNGSDYPLPAINIIINTGTLARKGFITPTERKYLNEIYGYNPLLFDFVLKRTVKAPGTDEKLPPSLFMENSNILSY